MPDSPQENQQRRAPRLMSRSQRKLLLFFLKCVIMAIVMSLFLFFLGFAAIVLLHFLFMSNTFSRRCTRLLHPAPAEADPEPDFEALLPGVAYCLADSPQASDCAICLDSFREGDNCRKIPICKHLFHSNCVDRWIGRKPNCPVCRTRVDLDPPGGDRWKNLWAVNFEEGASY
ncbi:RING-H2 finger protein ATL56-like [Salvia miltiorrhiza]|uniref:RING-H2 finger protein ATL56-like n=1 Tax=Salvia miltiorrhiza TaxID=226208 RepID=UPI0025ABBC49|nr:RING-H2 finger protein ATL56-like [Salvia miltiorrhiza]